MPLKVFNDFNIVSIFTFNIKATATAATMLLTLCFPGNVNSTLFAIHL